MAKDTEKLIRQLSLISYLMAERRPVTATEIRRDVEGYSDMTEDAFARRFYADRAELDALGIHLTVDKPAEGFSEQENYSLAPEAFHLPAIAFTDTERAALQTALSLLDGEFAYAEPLRLALQQITWGRPSPLGSDARQTIGLGITASAGGAEFSGRLAKLDTAIYRRKRIEFEYHTMQSDETALRKVDPYHLLYEGGQFYLVGWSHEREDVRMFRLSRIRGKVAYATKAEHDFQRPADFDPRGYARRIPWQLGDPVGTGEVWISDSIAWYVERQFGAYGRLRKVDDGHVFTTDYALPRLLISWALRLGEHARVEGPPKLADEAQERVRTLIDRHRGEPEFLTPVEATTTSEAADGEPETRSRGGETAIRPERFARLVTLASVLIAAGREDRSLKVAEVCEQLQMSDSELREDISVLNVVNFGGGAYVIYAEVHANGEIEVDPEPYSDTFDRPARLLPIEAKALVAAIDLIGGHLAKGALDGARDKIVAALGFDPVEEGLQVTTPIVSDDIAGTVDLAVHEQRLLTLEYYAPNEDRYSHRTVEPYALFNSTAGWYVAAFDPDKDGLRHFRLDRIKSATLSDETFERRADLDPIADVGGWPSGGRVGGSHIARVWISPDQARWVGEERTVLERREGGAIVVEWPYKGTDYLVREVLKEAGDAAVLEPADAREAVLDAAMRLQQLAPSS